MPERKFILIISFYETVIAAALGVGANADKKEAGPEDLLPYGFTSIEALTVRHNDTRNVQ